KQIQEGVAEALPTALEERESELRTSIREELGQENRLRGLAGEARRIIEAAKLPQSAKDNLLEDYGVTEADDTDELVAGRSLALIEAEVDDDDKVVKSAKDVLKDAIESDVKRTRNVLREAAPSMPRAPGGSADEAAPPAFGEGSGWADRVKSRGLDPKHFGIAAAAPAGNDE